MVKVIGVKDSAKGDFQKIWTSIREHPALDKTSILSHNQKIKIPSAPYKYHLRSSSKISLQNIFSKVEMLSSTPNLNIALYSEKRVSGNAALFGTHFPLNIYMDTIN
jgi:hypothetical protein